MPAREELFPPSDAQRRHAVAKRVFSDLDEMDEALRLDALNAQRTEEEGPCGAVVACQIAERLGLAKDAYWEHFASMTPREAYREMTEVLQLPIQARYREMAERTGEDGRVKV